MVARRRADGWRGPRTPGEFPTLGHVVAEWIEANCVIPDGVDAGQPFVLTDEQYRFVLWHYRLRVDATVDRYRPSSVFAFRRSMLVRPQKWGKGPLSAALICAEAEGPVLFDGWDGQGEPVGRSWDTPWIQVAATSEDQTDNVWRALLPMITEGPLAEAIPDTGETRINLRGGGFVEPVTASGTSRLGQRLTFAVHDEPHSWTERNGGWRLADTQRRNLAGMGGRSIGTTNAWDPAEMSDAQRTFEAHLADVHVDFPASPAGSLRNKRERRRVLKAAYGDSHWVDLSRIEAEVDELIAKNDLAQAERFFANRIVALGDRYFDADAWQAIEDGSLPVPDGAMIAVGFDGSQNDDWTAIRARWIRPNGLLHAFTPRFDDGKPMFWDPVAEGGEVPVHEVHAAVEQLFGQYQVLRLYADPPFWQTQVDEWASRWPQQVIRWETYRTRQMAAALERLRTDVGTRRLTQDGCPHMLDHLRHARSVRRPGGVVIGKPSPGLKIDIAMADALAHEAACDAVTAGETTPKRTYSGKAGGFN